MLRAYLFGCFLALVLFFNASSTGAETISLGEALDNDALTWTTGGEADWFGQTSIYYSGGDAAQSGAVTSSEQSWLQTTATGPAIISFRWRVSQWAMFRLRFYIDDVERASCYRYEEWEKKTYLLPAGNHKLRWVFEGLLAGEAGYLDQVVLLPGPDLLLTFPNGGETLKQRDFYSIQWIATADSGPSVKLVLLQNGQVQEEIASSTANDGSFSWFVPLTLEPADVYRIRVISTGDPQVFDESDTDFKIEGPAHPALGGLLLLDGDDDFVEAVDSPDLDLGDEQAESFTLETWFYLREGSTSPIDRHYIFVKPGSYSLYALRYYDWSISRYMACLGCTLTLSGGSTQGFEHCRSSGFGLGWHHVALVYSLPVGEAQLYLDGSSYGTPRVIGGPLANSSENLALGKNLSGAIDETRLSSKARYSGATYTLPYSPFVCDAETRSLWHFDELDGATAFADSCGAENNSLFGRNGARAAGLPGFWVFLPVSQNGSGAGH